MADDYKTIKERKEKHISNCLEKNISFENKTTLLENYDFIHQALPELDLNEIDLSITVKGKKLKAPLMISPMVGGTDRGRDINLMLAECAEEMGIGFSVGSQRITKIHKESLDTYRVRKTAPNILLFANLGLVQLNYGFTLADCINVKEEIDADILTFHLNPLQEAIQHGGDVNFKGLGEKLRHICKNVDFPIVVKEVGHGISEETARSLVDKGVFGIDTAGAGGTSWSKVESRGTEETVRTETPGTEDVSGTEERETGESLKCRVGSCFSEWGIPTATSIRYVRKASPDIFLIASGGIKTGLDAAKAIALGADMASVGLPIFKLAAHGKEKVMNYLRQTVEELRLAMFLTGSGDLGELKKAKMVEKK